MVLWGTVIEVAVVEAVDVVDIVSVVCLPDTQEANNRDPTMVANTLPDPGPDCLPSAAAGTGVSWKQSRRSLHLAELIANMMHAASPTDT
jgi:hypothetical protein